MSIRIFVAPAIDLGNTPAGRRRIVNITGGEFSGPLLRGNVLCGGADWQFVRPDAVTSVEARYTLQTRDGALIYLQNTGLRHGPPDIIEKLVSGESVDPGSYYFRTTARFEVSEPRYAWLNQHIFIGIAERRPESILVHVFQVL